MLVIYSILHFIVDGVCAFAMFGEYGADGANAYLFYNLCAFALQMPIGALIDLVTAKMPGKYIAQKRFYSAVTALGVIVTLAGMYAGPLALGFGNALFHEGGGVTSIAEDRRHEMKGRGLGIFVAPGAMGLFVGKIVSEFTSLRLYAQSFWIIISILLLLASVVCLYYDERHFLFIETVNEKDGSDTKNAVKEEKNNILSRMAENNSNAKNKESIIMLLLASLGCFAVVIIRSYVGLAVAFDWKSGLTLSFLAVLAVVFGKVAGGFAAAKFGDLKTVLVSLFLAAVCFVFSDIAVFGLLALFLFNMTMPITLYMLVRRMSGLPGFSFGLLTLGLFLGFLMVYCGVALPVSGRFIGCFGSIVSAAVLAGVIFTEHRENGK